MTIQQNKLNPRTAITKSSSVITKKDDALSIAIVNNIGSAVSNSALPIAAVIIAKIFRSEFASLLARIRSFKGLGLEASLDAVIQSSLPPVTTDENSPIDQVNSKLINATVSISPNDVVFSSWISLEQALRAKLSAKNLSQGTSIRSLIGAIDTLGNTPTGLKARVNELFSIRNRLTHSPDLTVSTDSANLFRENAAKAISEIEQSAPSK